MDRKIRGSVPIAKKVSRLATLAHSSYYGEELIVYLSVSPTIVSAVLIREEDDNQKPIYYVGKVLLGVETRYLKIEKLAYALLIAVRNLRHYFQAHPITVLTDQSLKLNLE